MLLTLMLIGCQGTGGNSLFESERLVSLKRQAAKAYSENRYADALPLYQKLNEEIPDDAHLWLRTGNTHARLNQPQDALRSYREALKYDSKLGNAWHNMGIIQLRQAANTFTRMVQHIDPDDPLYQRAIDMSEATLDALTGRSKGNNNAE